MKRYIFRCLIALLLVLSTVICLPSCDIIDDALDEFLTSQPDSGTGKEPTDTEDVDGESSKTDDSSPSEAPSAVDLDSIPAFTTHPYVIINNNKPFFTDDEIVSESYEYYGELDSLGRCTETVACVGVELLPTEDRGSIGQVKPSGWHTVKYDCVDGKYLYNRCHLIGYQLTGENANVNNLITGTRYLNVIGMLPFENQIADYVKETENHVMYRVTPIFSGSNLVASGVLMEGWSVEDEGYGICFNVYAYNNQPGVIIDYKTGISRIDDSSTPSVGDDATEDDSGITDDSIPDDIGVYYVNVNTHKYHKESCRYATGDNVERRECSEMELIEDGNDPCGHCKP